MAHLNPMRNGIDFSFTIAAPNYHLTLKLRVEYGGWPESQVSCA